MNYDEIPELPYLENENESFNNEDLRKAKSKFIFYQEDEGEIKLSYSKLDAELYACFLAKFSQPKFTKVYEFLKLALEGIRLIKKEDKRSYQMLARIEKYLKDK